MKTIQETRPEKMKEEIKTINPSKKEEGRIVRILSKDIEGNYGVYTGLTKVRGVSWGISNAICRALKIDKKRKISSLTNEEIEKISKFIKNPIFPAYLFNRQKDFETNENKHLIGADLELQTEFDIKRLKKIKSYRGLRHSLGQPTRGQRTKGHFRKNKSKGVGIKKKKSKVSESKSKSFSSK